MPSADVAAHLAAFCVYVGSALVAHDPERIARSKHVFGVALDPGHDEERCEVLLRAACDAQESVDAVDDEDEAQQHAGQRRGREGAGWSLRSTSGARFSKNGTIVRLHSSGAPVQALTYTKQ